MRKFGSSGRRTLATLALMVPWFLVGCDIGKFPLVPVQGRVTFDGATCPKAGNVTFQPIKIEEGLPRRPASAQFDVDGAYEVNAFPGQEGVLPGRYRVEVTCYSGAPDFSKSDPWGAVNYIDSSYKPMELVVDASSDAMRVDIDVPRNKSKDAPQ